MAMTVAFAISGALILSLTYVPLMCAVFLSKTHHNGNFSDKMMHFLYFRLFEPAFRVSVKYKVAVLSAVAVLLMLALFTFTKIGGEFIPKLDEGIIQIETRLPVGSSLSQSIATSLKIEDAILKALPNEIEHVVAKIGTSEIPLDPVPMESADVIILTKDKKEWKAVHSKSELIEKIMDVYSRFPGLVPSVQQPIEARFNDLLSGAKTDVVFKLYGKDLDAMTQISKDVMSVLRNIQGAADVQMQIVEGLPQVKVVYNRRDIALYGISVQQINDAIQSAFAGNTTGIVYEEDRRYDLVVKLETAERNRIETLENLNIKDSYGNLIPLKQLATITLENGPAEIRHVNKQRCIQIGANVRGRDMESLVNEANVLIKKKANLPHGYTLEAGGQYENLRKAKERLSIVLPIALVVIFALLFASFRTFKDSILIFSAVPMSAIGGIFALFITSINFSISAGVGFICFFGIAVLNGILLVSQFRLLLKDGSMTLEEAVSKGIEEKFRPVLMTSAVAALGFMPMTLATGAGAEVQKPLATVVIGGLTVSTFLTLFVLPILFLIFNKKKKVKYYEM